MTERLLVKHAESPGKLPLLTQASTDSAGEPKKIKPIQKLCLYNDHVRRMTVVDGQPQPVPYLSVVRVDIIKCFVFMYAYFNLISLFLACVAVRFLRHALFPEHCSAGVHWWAGIMTFLVVVNGILCLTMTGLLAYYRARMPDEYYIWRVALGRLQVMTRTTSSRWLFYCVYAQDAVSALIIVVGWPLAKAARQCDAGYQMFYVITLIYETLSIVRLLVALFHFRYGQAVYRRLKRRFAVLNTAEYGRGVELDVYRAQEFLD